MVTAEEIQAAVDKNFAAFKAKLPELIKEYPGKYVVMRDEKVVEAFDSVRDARIYGESQFPDGLFSIQQVTTQLADLGFFSHALRFIQTGPEQRSDT